MPKNKVSDPITDRQAAEVVGLNPDSAAVQQQLVQQEVEGQRRLNPDREQVLNRLWEIANLSPEMTRNSITGQVKAISIIVAMQNFIPDRRAASAEKNLAPAPAPAQFYKSAWLRELQAATPATTNDPQPTPAPPVPACRGAQQEEAPEVPQPDFAPEPASGSAAEPPPAPVSSQPAFAHRVPLADGLPPYVPQFTSVPDTRVPFSIKVNPFKHRR
jgi:hypothetical protein